MVLYKKRGWGIKMDKNKKNSNKREKRGLVDFFIHHKLCICIIISLLYFGTIGFFIFHKTELGKIYYATQILVSFFAIVGTIVAVFQYVSNSNIAKVEADKQKKIEAARLANDFRGDALPLINKLIKAYAMSDLEEKVLKVLEKSNLKDFNKNEVDSIFGEKNVVNIRILIGENYLKNNKSNLENSKEDSTVQILDAVKEVGHLATDISNLLEYYCICFNTNIADDETVYQSLHDVFFITVHMVYIFSFYGNINEHNRKFYNIMVLYKKWKKISDEKQEAEEENIRKLQVETELLKESFRNKIAVSTTISSD